MALLPPNWLECVLCIGVPGQAAPTRWCGTGILVGRPLTDGKAWLFIATNKHVVASKPLLVVRFPGPDGTVVDVPFDFTKPGALQWWFHPEDSVDVAVLPISASQIEAMGVRLFWFDPSMAYTRDEMIAAGICEGDGVFILGFPLGLVGNDRKHAIARAGIIARSRDCFEDRSKTFLVDANIFPGNSGGPVILRPELANLTNTQSHSQAKLIGIVKSYLPYNDVAISQQTGNPRVIFEENSGLAYVETFDKISHAMEQQLKSVGLV